MVDHGSTITAAHVKLASLRDDQRMKILSCARAVKLAKSDRDKRRRALRDLDQCLQFYEAAGVLTHRDQENMWYALNRGI